VVVCIRKRICHRAAAPKLKKRKNALNTPGAWHFMISYTQRSDRAIALATKLEKDLAHRGYSVWLDVNMNDKSEAAMKEAVEHSMVVLALITGGAPNLDDDNAYLKRAFCLSELRWAFSAITDPNLPLKHLQPLVRMDDKNNIGAFIAMAPDDLKHIGNIDFVDLNTTDNNYWTVGVENILKKAVAAGAFPKGSTLPVGRRAKGIETAGDAIPGIESACGEAGAAPKTTQEHELEQAAEDPALSKSRSRREESVKPSTPATEASDCAVEC